ncbi:hypothetical protein G6011_04958 [Alternaria panax]|uniref:Uncharacterized protein n=1 Tax=Alternaria panax TaxID=48097 RepID=A0AAD4FBR5_9PLEO|nr:hypothetical protein G6011_04958 [Alternaria panax]
MPPHHPTHIQHHKAHVDHDLIVHRLEEYIRAYRSGKPEAMMESYHPTNIVYSDFSTSHPQMTHKQVHETYKKTFSNFHDFDTKSLSVHGHKHFTAWEREMTCKPTVNHDTGERIDREMAEKKKLVGC